MLGTRNSTVFAARMQEWLPPLRKRYPLRPPEDASHDAELIKCMHAGRSVNKELVATYPAHLHIDLLPLAQGKKMGHKLMDAFLDRLTTLGVAGVHLGTNTDNTQEPWRSTNAPVSRARSTAARRCFSPCACRARRVNPPRPDLPFNVLSGTRYGCDAPIRSRRQQLAYVYFEDEPGQRLAAKLSQSACAAPW